MSEEQQKALLKILSSIAWYQGRRDHSPVELRRKLAKRYSKELIEEGLVEARERKLLKSDEELAQLWAEILGRKGRSHQYITSYLRKHKLPPVPRDADQELEKARALLKTKFGQFANFPREEQPKVVRFLQYRGFGPQIIRQVIYEKP